MRGVAGQKDPAHPPAVGEPDVVAVAGEAEDLHVVGGDSLIAEHLPDRLLGEQVLLVLLVAHRELPAVMTQRSGAVHGGPGRVAVEPQPVMAGPFPQHLGVDDDPTLAVGAPRIADTQLAADRAGRAVGGDHVRGPHPPEFVDLEIGEHQLHMILALHHPQALVLEQHSDVGEPLHPRAQHLFHRGLVDELLGWVPVAPRHRQQPHERHAVGVDEGGPVAGLHVGVELVGQSDLLPDAHHLLVGGDGPGPRIDVGIAFHHDDVQALLAQQVGRGDAHRSVADDRHVISRLVSHGRVLRLGSC